MLLARLLGPAEYGRVSIALAVMTILNTVHSTGLPQAVSRHVAAGAGNGAAVLATAFGLQARATVGSALLVVLAAALGLAGPELAPYLVAAALTVVPHGLISLHMAYDNGLHDFRRQAGVLVAYSLAKTVAVILLALPWRGIGALVGYAVGSVAALAVGRHRVADAGRVPAADLVRFAVPVVALAGLSATQLNVDLLLVQSLRGSSAEAGWYGAAQQIARVPYLALTGLGMVLLPIAARRAAETDRSGLAALVRESIRYAVLLLAPAVAILAVAGPATVDLLYSAGYEPAAAPLPVLAPGVAALTLFSILAAVLTGLGRPWLPVAIAAAALAMTVVACLVLIPAHGLVGAALGTTLGGLTALGGVLVALGPVFGWLVAPLMILRVAAAAALLGAILAVVRPTGAGLLLVAAAGTLAYGGALVVLRELGSPDRDRVMAVLGRRPASSDAGPERPALPGSGVPPAP